MSAVCNQQTSKTEEFIGSTVKESFLAHNGTTFQWLQPAAIVNICSSANLRWLHFDANWASILSKNNFVNVMYCIKWITKNEDNKQVFNPFAPLSGLISQAVHTQIYFPCINFYLLIWNTYCHALATCLDGKQHDARLCRHFV